MANRLKGEVAIETSDKTYVIRFSANAICEMEDALGLGINEVATQLSDPSGLRVKTVRAVFWASLRDHHPDVTIHQAGEILTEVTIGKAMKHVTEAFELAFEDKSPARPLKPGSKGPASKSEAAGTGPLS